MKKFNFHDNDESGVTLIVAIMIMSAISIITTTIAFFVIQEIRNARSSALTEPAISAAESAGEQGIYQIKRSGFNTFCGSESYTQLNESAGGVTNTRIRKCIATGPATVQISDTEPLVSYLYDPTNINGNTCLEAICPPDPNNGEGSGNQLYSSIKVKHVTGSGFPLDVTIETLDGVPYITDSIPLGITESYNIDRNIVGSDDERLKVTLSLSSGTATAEISTTGDYNGFPDYQTIDAEGCVGVVNITDCDQVDETYKRRINITVPK